MADELKPQEAGDDKYLDEIHKAFEKDNEDGKRIGQVWKLSEQGLDAPKIAEKLEVPTPGFVFSNRTYIKAIKEGILPNAPTTAKQCASTLRGFVKRHQELLSDESVSLLQERADGCTRRANDPAKWEEEEQKLERQTSAAEKDEVSGIYVYALPHYLRYPVEISDPENDETDDRTYLKVGMSKRNPKKRVQGQAITALPEPPILLRIYVGLNGTDIEEVERKIHRHLAAADHVRNSERGAGQEWFLTHLKLLDSTAELLGLKTHFSVDDSDDD